VAFDARFGVPFPLHEWNNEPMWMEVDIGHSLLGKVRSFLYKPPACYLVYRCVGQTNIIFRRFVTSICSSGCLLTPFISDDGDLLAFYRAGKRPNDLQRVESIGFFCAPADRKYFQADIRIRLYSAG
jgi:hypothetical protein